MRSSLRASLFALSATLSSWALCDCVPTPVPLSREDAGGDVTPDGSLVDSGAHSDATTPDASAPDVRAPDVSASDGSAPDGSAPDGSAPDASVLDASVPDGSESDGGGAPAVYAHAFGGLSFDTPLQLALDALDRVYVLGMFMDSVDYGAGRSSETEQRAEVIALDARGALRWHRPLDVRATPFPLIAVDDGGDVWALGTFGGRFVVAPDGAPAPVASNVTLVHFASDGTPQPSRILGLADRERVASFAVRSDGSVAVVGALTQMFSPTATALVPTVGVFDRTGAVRWSMTFTDRSVGLRSVAFDAAGNVYALATISAPLRFAGVDVVPAGTSDVAVMRFAPDGTPQWCWHNSGAGAELAGAFSVAPDGTSALLGDEAQHAVWSLDATGATLWRWNAASDVVPVSVSRRDDGSVWVGGARQGRMDRTWGGGGFLPDGGRDAYAAMLTRDGRTQWDARYASDYVESASAVALGRDTAWMLGGFLLTLTFGGETVRAYGGSDLFLTGLAR